MKKMLIIIISILFAHLSLNSQNLFLIGERSYLCSNKITLESNAQYEADLDVFLAKDGKSGVIGIIRKSKDGQVFVGKLIVYLEDGNVLTINESGVAEKVDDNAKSLYFLSNEQLISLRTSNIHTVKYSMSWVGTDNFSASNKGIKTNEIIDQFFKE